MKQFLIAAAAAAIFSTSAFAEGSPIRIDGKSQAEASQRSADRVGFGLFNGFGLTNRTTASSADRDRRNDRSSDDRRPIGGFGPGITWQDVYTGR